MKGIGNGYIIALLSVIVVGMLAVPGIADYSGDQPLTTYEHGMINGGGIVYESVTDGSGYTKLNAIDSATYTQDITISIPEGKTVKTARLYNYVTWSTSDNDTGVSPWFISGVPAEAELTFSDGTSTWTKTCVHNYTDAQRSDVPNPILYGDDAMQYWDAKGQDYDCGAKYDYPSGTFAWDVTDMVTGNGVYTAEIVNADSTPTGMRPGSSTYCERFATFGFGLLVVYENDDPEAEPDTEYWIAEGCDLLYNTSKYSVYEPIATTSVQFEKELNGPKSATLTTVLTASNKWNLTDWDESKNMVSFNGNEIGPSTAVDYKAIGVNEFDVGKLKHYNIADFLDRDLGTGKGDNSVVSNAFLVTE